MSVLIKGINIHRGRCWECPCLDGEYGDCNVLEKGVHDIEYDECPIIEIHDHGDLIDRNMLIGGFADWYIQESPMYLGDNKVVAETIGEAMKAIEAAPVVIPAERSEE